MCLTRLIVSCWLTKAADCALNVFFSDSWVKTASIRPFASYTSHSLRLSSPLMIQSKSGHCTYHPRTGTQISLMKKQAQRSVIILVWAGWQMSHGDTENIRRRITDYSYSWMFTWVIRRSFKNQELMILLFCVTSLRNDSCQLFPHVNICHWFQPLGVEPRVSHHLICACVCVLPPHPWLYLAIGIRCVNMLFYESIYHLEGLKVADNAGLTEAKKIRTCVSTYLNPRIRINEFVLQNVMFSGSNL